VLFASTGLYPELSFSILQSPSLAGPLERPLQHISNLKYKPHALKTVRVDMFGFTFFIFPQVLIKNKPKLAFFLILLHETVQNLDIFRTIELHGCHVAHFTLLSAGVL
jgi:hypothetical protein